MQGVTNRPSDSPLFSAVTGCHGSPPSRHYFFLLQDDACTGDIVGMTYNAGCAPVPTNGTYPGDYFMAECAEGVAAADDDDGEEEEEDIDDASGAVSSLGFGRDPRSLLSVSGAVASAAAAAAVAIVSSAAMF